MRIRWGLALILFCASFSISSPKSAPIYKPTPGHLDSIKVHKLYLDGEFDQAIEILNATLKEKRTLAHGDSAFIFKHLGVMYAANYETREKGKYFMNQLLLVEPSAVILDMYASDMIYMIFKNIQDEFASNRMRNNIVKASNTSEVPEAGNTASSNGKSRKGSSEHSNTIYWVGAGAAAVAVGVVAYFVITSQSTPKESVNF